MLIIIFAWADPTPSFSKTRRRKKLITRRWSLPIIYRLNNLLKKFNLASLKIRRMFGPHMFLLMVTTIYVPLFMTIEVKNSLQKSQNIHIKTMEQGERKLFIKIYVRISRN